MVWIRFSKTWHRRSLYKWYTECKSRRVSPKLVEETTTLRNRLPPIWFPSPFHRQHREKEAEGRGDIYRYRQLCSESGQFTWRHFDSQTRAPHAGISSAQFSPAKNSSFRTEPGLRFFSYSGPILVPEPGRPDRRTCYAALCHFCDPCHCHR